MIIAQHSTHWIKILRYVLVICLVLILALLWVDSAGLAQTDDVWSPPINLSQSGSANDPIMIVDSEGIYHILWFDEFAEFVYVNGDGADWSSPEVVTLPFDESIPVLIADTIGYIHAFWRDEDDILRYSRVRASSFSTTSLWSAPLRLDESALDIAVTIDGNGDIHISYVRPLATELFPPGVYYQRLKNGSTNWSPPILLYLSPYFRSLELTDSNVSIATAMVDEEVNVYVAWDNRPRERVYLAQSTDGGDTWSPPEEVDRPEEGAVNPGPANILVDAAEERVLLLWQANRSESSCEQYYQFSNDAGDTWSPRLRMFEGFVICPDDIQALTFDEGSIFLLNGVQVYLQAWDGQMWSDPQLQQTLTTFIDPDTQRLVDFGCQLGVLSTDRTLHVIGCDNGEGQDIWLTQRQLLDIASWYPQEAVWSPVVRVTNSESRLSSPVLIADDADRMHAFWSLAESSNPDGPGTAIYYARWEEGQWSQPEMVLTSPDGKADQPAASSDAQNRLFVVWSGGLDGEIYFSHAEAGQAVVPSTWIEPIQLPSQQKAGSTPSILIDSEGVVNVVYSIPLNEDRGIYLVRSDDRGQTWSSPKLIIDAEEAGWAMVGDPKLTMTANGDLHVLWTRYSMPPSSSPLSLMYANSDDSGLTWSNPQIVEDTSVTWSQIVGTDEETVHRVWQEASSTGTTLWHEQSLDGGENWFRTVPVSVFGDTVGAPSLSWDNAGRLHLLLVVRSGENSFVIQHWLYDGERWSAERNLDVEFTTNTDINSVVGNVSNESNLGVLLSDLIRGETGNGQQRELLFSNRQLEVPSTAITPIQEATPTPQVTATITPTIQPTNTPSPNLATPTSTTFILPDDPSPSSSSSLIAIAGPVVIGFIALGVLFIVIRGVRNWR